MDKTDKIMKKLLEHDKRFDQQDKRFDQQDKRFDQQDKRFDQQDKQIDLLARTVLNHTERLDRIEEKMATKDDIVKITTTLDTLVGLAKKKDQELTLMSHSMRIMRDEIGKIKPLVGLT